MGKPEVLLDVARLSCSFTFPPLSLSVCLSLTLYRVSLSLSLKDEAHKRVCV